LKYHYHLGEHLGEYEKKSNRRADVQIAQMVHECTVFGGICDGKIEVR
jgi:hypothetical protein